MFFIGFHQIPHVQLMRNIGTSKHLQNDPKMDPYALQNVVLKAAYFQHRFHADFESILGPVGPIKGAKLGRPKRPKSS